MARLTIELPNDIVEMVAQTAEKQSDPMAVGRIDPPRSQISCLPSVCAQVGEAVYGRYSSEESGILCLPLLSEEWN